MLLFNSKGQPLDFDRDTTITLATAAYWAALHEQREQATAHVQKLNDDYGAEAVLLACCAWIDTYIDHVTDGGDASHMRRLKFIEKHSGRIDNADSAHLPDEVQWAGKLIHARATMDPDLFLDLVNEVEDNREAGYRVMILLDLVAQTVRHMPRGFAKRGARRADPSLN